MRSIYNAYHAYPDLSSDPEFDDLRRRIDSFLERKKAEGLNYKEVGYEIIGLIQGKTSEMALLNSAAVRRQQKAGAGGT